VIGALKMKIVLVQWRPGSRTAWLQVIALLGSLAWNTAAVADAEPAQTYGLLLADHPLVDRIFDVNGKHMVDQSQLFKRLADADYVLLGETHDNTVHHGNQARVIDQLATTRRSASVAFEMIDDSQGKFINDRNITSSDDFIELLNYFDTGWDYKNYYRPVFDSVIRAGFRIYPANIDRNRLMNILMQDSLDVPDGTARILSKTPLTPELEIDMQQDIIEAHCDMLDAEQAKPMVRAQRIRDATMASSLLNSASDLRVLIAGNGHVRKDIGVPRYLLTGDGTASIVSIGMVEVDADQYDVAAYERKWVNHRLPFDYVWFTARADREDPCIDFIKQHDKRQ
jgi:uncharacterized iron-regulated protein